MSQVSWQDAFSTLRYRMSPETQERAHNESEALEAALIEGDESGEPQPLDNGAFNAQMRAKYLG